MKAQDTCLGDVNLQASSQDCEKRLVASSCLSVQLGSHWTYLNETLYLTILGEYVEKILVSLKYDNNNRYFTWRSTL